MTADVTVELAESGFVLGGVFEQLRPMDPAAANGPIGIEESVKGREFNRVKRFAVRVGDDEVGGREAALAGVEGGVHFALFGARAGGELRVGALGIKLDWR